MTDLNIYSVIFTFIACSDNIGHLGGTSPLSSLFLLVPCPATFCAPITHPLLKNPGYAAVYAKTITRSSWSLGITGRTLRWLSYTSSQTACSAHPSWRLHVTFDRHGMWSTFRRAWSWVPILFHNIRSIHCPWSSDMDWRHTSMLMILTTERRRPSLWARRDLYIADVADWMRSNRLQLNIDKTGLLWCSSSRRQHQLPSAPISFGGNDVTASSVVRRRGVFVDLDLSLRRHVDANSQWWAPTTYLVVITT
jgi:hypothetical protein